MKPAIVLTALALLAGPAPAETSHGAVQSRVLIDPRRGREIPIDVHLPVAGNACLARRSCPVAFISSGYGLPHTSYRFIAQALAETGYLAVTVQHDLPGDPPLARSGNLVSIRMPMWQRGAHNLRFLRQALPRLYPAHDWRALTLIGHSNGGDISALALDETPALAATLVTLDHRRYRLPRNPAIRVMSIRASDFEADEGVLPVAGESQSATVCITRIDDARHDDMHDEGPAWLLQRIRERLLGFLGSGRCAV